MSSIGKHIERLVRRGLLLALRALPEQRGDLRRLNGLSSPRILLVRPDRIGDTIISTAAIMLLRERFPEGRIDMLLGEKNRSAGPLLPELDEIHVIPTSPGGIIGTIRRVRRRRYDLAINLLAKDSASGAFLTGLAGAGVSIGFAGKSAGIYTLAVEKPAGPMHIVPETSLLLAPLGIEPIGAQPRKSAERLHITIPEDAARTAAEIAGPMLAEARGPVVVVNISGSSPEKFLGVEKYIEAARKLLEHGMTPVVAGAPADREQIAAIAGGAGALMFPVTRSLAEFAALLGHAGLIATPDTSVVHIAAALGKPTVAMVPAGNTGAAWGPWGVPSIVLAGSGPITGIASGDLVESIISLASATVGLPPTSPPAS